MLTEKIPKMTRQKIQVTGAVLVKDGLILAAQRSLTKSQGGLWEFPGGKVEPGETPEQSLARELKEELLCDAKIGDLITTSEHTYEHATIVLSTYFCTLLGNAPRLTEHQEIRWMKPEELATLDWAPADIPTVEILQSGNYSSSSLQER
ncbi:(deoxy)nucleoside triphosphate pyrophosphohydrolase [Corynebacterium sp. SCR221107]|uniref:(deoxy)nucleoside triphosphate pyrophosphohydrolase n=1 Tax=Corynebacterium sp. SCR221107 TaxID=3017361 RepID=UPI0022EC66AD|nr:(deoxy)nucleoside triphosphate pyrophosphohydrolase [Corynebacterium sp. SCR221107]WBT09763.1 (deoxy)nucleoside triphosphate pyrophosphohydrolase [Corynebacterium sp. SCR221107]